MKKIYILLVSIILGVTTNSYSQRACGTMQHLEEQMMNDPDLVQRMQDIETQTQNWVLQNQKNPTTQAVINIPVVVHVLYNSAVQNISDAQIFSQMDVLNEDFRKLNADVSLTPSAFAGLAADCQLNFCLAQRDPNGNPTTGIIRKATTVTSFSTNNNMKFSANGGDDAWNTSQYLNIWVCNLGNGLLGYAQFPGGAAATDGVVVLYTAFGRTGTLSAPFNKGRTATHEVGHWLNLRHIWGDANCGNDQVNDTPTQQTSNYGCPTFPKVTCSNGPNGDMFMNYMDYTNDACMYMFTTGQSTRMSAAINASRPGLITSLGCSAPTGGGTTCNAPTGLTTSAITTNSATINWSAVSGAASYVVNYRLSTSTTWTVANTTSTSFNITGLTASTSYQYQVRTVCASIGSSVFSTIGSFTTAAAGCTDIYEANNSRNAAKTIATNTNIFALIGNSTDRDYYRFSTVSGNTNIRMTLDQLVADYDLRLLNNSGSTLATSQLTGSSAETITRNTTTAATYFAYVYNFNGAFSATACYRLRVNTSGTAFRNGSSEENFGNVVAEKMTGLDAVQLFPNPADNTLNLSFFNSDENVVTAKVIDMLGKVVYVHSMTSEGGFQETSLSTAELPAGVYLLQVSNGSESISRRFVVRH
jgi:hypothetical protein